MEKYLQEVSEMSEKQNGISVSTVAMMLIDAVEWLDNLEIKAGRDVFLGCMPNNGMSRTLMRPTADKAKQQVLGHQRRTTASGRQICCRTCHTCLRPLEERLDDELWCPRCMAYR
jgi:uncharacterized paraquat-inducible protein A